MIVTGTNFTGASAVELRAGNPATTFTVNSSTSITATAPSGTGTVDVTVTTSGGTSATSSADQFTYQAGTAAADDGRHVPRRPRPKRLLPVPDRRHDRQRGHPQAALDDDNGRHRLLLPSRSWPTTWCTGGTGTATSTGPISRARTSGRRISGSTPTAPARLRWQESSGTATAAMMGTTSVLYVPGGDDNFYALNALTGAIIWKTNLGTPPGDFLWSSPILYNGSIYEGVASFGDCPLVQGQLVQMNATTGAIEHIADMVPNGCIGGGIWSSPAIDPSDGSIYVTTGTPNGCNTPEMSPAIVKLRASDLTILSSWTIPQSELYSTIRTSARPRRSSPPPSMACSRSLVGALNKNGLFYAWDRNDLAAGPVWQTRIADPAGGPLSIVSAAWDGHDAVRGRRQYDHQRHELLREHLRARPGDRSVHLARRACRAA